MKNKKHYIKKKIRYGYLVVNTRTGCHSHVTTSYGAGCILLFLREGITPDSDYLRESVKRLQDKPDRKQRYVNIRR